MTYIQIMAIAKDMLITGAYLAGPTILISMIVGTLVSIFQTVTSIQEQTLSFAPRLVAAFLVLLLTLPWSLRVATAFAMRMFAQAAEISR